MSTFLGNSAFKNRFTEIDAKTPQINANTAKETAHVFVTNIFSNYLFSK